MAPVKPRRGRSKYGLMRSLSYSPPSSLKNGQDLDSCATPEGVTVETENRDPQEVGWESESREPPGTALKQRNRKQQLRSRTNRLKNHLWELDPESLKRRLWNLRGENQYPPIPETPQEYQCADQRCWMCDDCETPWPSSPTEAYLRDVSVTSAAEGEEECMDSGMVTKAMPEELNENVEVPKMARNFENMHLGDVNLSCITCVCAENDQ
ncbi:uncharacterized protein LOC128327394 [Hemicordylus capensis]|uniref:uncharacterized protein LOC128327394 n=1 Tax=Hemicordylus capensis TaxID=884348 RepID=UPI002303B9BB|nr:uncharacterized protein LOC128327394 [Hemicordylus capensis]